MTMASWKLSVRRIPSANAPLLYPRILSTDLDGLWLLAEWR
jgi:hypothetical protein